MKRNVHRSLILGLILISGFSSVIAHEITLKNGDRLSGVVISRDSEAVVLETQYAGRIKIAVEFISAIDSERFAASVTTPASVSASNVPTNTKPSDGTPSAAAKVVADQTDKPVDSTTKKTPRLFGGRYLGIADGWEGNANIGFSYTTGNSNTATLTTGIRASKAGHRDKLTVYIRNLWNTNRNAPQSTTQNAVWGGFRYDRDLKQRLFTFGSWDFERDRPKRLNFRSVIGGGLGNHTIKNDRTELDLLIGLAWNRAWQIGENNDSPESLGAVALKHKFTERLKIQNSFTFYQDLTRLKKYRFIFDASLSADITKRIGWHFTIGDRFNNDPLISVERNDFLLTTGIKWNFGKKR